MGFTPEQIKGRIKSVAKQNNADARTLMRIYMMERFLERLAQSEYRDNFIIKGGILVTAMIGVAHRSTMDIDTSMKNLNLSAEDALRVVNRVKDIDLDDGVSFDVKDVSNIMDEMEYPGIRVTMNANVGRLITPLKIDISTGDVITPRAIEFNYDLLLEDRSISLWSYNLETILAEKLQTVLARGILNTRMRDFYDIRMLLDTYEDKVNKAVLKDAFAATCKKRGTDHLQEQAEEIIKIIEADEQLQVLWRAYQKKYSYAAEIDYASVISGVRKLMDWMIRRGDAFIAFPGGTGTLEEIAEVMSKVSLKQLDAPCVLYNLNGYYNGLKTLLDHMIETGLSTKERQEGIWFAENLEQIKQILKA